MYLCKLRVPTVPCKISLLLEHAFTIAGAASVIVDAMHKAAPAVAGQHRNLSVNRHRCGFKVCAAAI